MSVVVPVRDRRGLIADAVDGALSQTRPAFEVIVVDDGSVDGTTDLLERRYGDTIRLERFERTRGRSAARNRGLAVARGELVAFLDSDDVWHRDKLERQAPLFSDDAVSIVHGAVEAIDAEGYLLPERSMQCQRLLDCQQERGYDYAGLTEPWCGMWTSTVVARRVALDRHGGFDESLDHFEDWDLFWRMTMDGQVRTVAEPVVGYRVHAGNTDHDVHRAAPSWLAVNRKHMAVVAKTATFPRRRRALRNLTLNLAIGELWRGNRSASRRLVLRALRIDPGLLRLWDHPVWGEALQAAARGRPMSLRHRMADVVPCGAAPEPSAPSASELPTMTVVIVSYQRRARLAHLLGRVATELRNDSAVSNGVDIVVVLDGSTDGSRELIDHLDYPVRLVGLWQSNRGRAAARNAGLRVATGDTVLFLDDDGVPEPGLIARHRRGQLGREEVLVGSCDVVGQTSVLPVLVDHSRRQHARLARPAASVTACQVTFANTSAPRRLLLEVGGFDEEFVGWGAEDGELGARLLKSGVSIRYDPSAVVRHEPELRPRGFLRSRVELGRNTVLLLDRHPELADAYLVPTSPALGALIGWWSPSPRTLQALGTAALTGGRALHPIAPDLGLGLMWLSWDVLVAAGLLSADRSGRWFDRFVAGASS